MAVLETREVKENAEMEPTAVVLPEGENVKDSTSPRGVLEIPVVGSDSDNSSSSSSSITENLTPQRLSNRESYGLQWRSMIDTIKKKSVRRFSVIPLLTNSDLTRKNLWKKLAKIQNSEDEPTVLSIPAAKTSWRNFEYSELSAATYDFIFHFVG